jgi:hypothetical protein
LSSGVVIWGLSSDVVIWGYHLTLSSGIVIWGCHLGLSSMVVIYGCHLGLSSGVVIWGCHLGLSSGVVIWCCHLGCHLGCHLVLSSEMTHSPFYLFIENFIHSQSGDPPAPYLEFLLFSVLLISYLKPVEKYLAYEPWTGTKCQLHSQSKLTTPRRENQKIQHKIVILKANELHIYRHQKHTTKSRETIPF